MIGTDAFQEADICGITLPITKHNFLVQRAEDIPRAIAEAFHLAATGRPGPVLVDIPKDVLQERRPFAWPPRIDLPGYQPVTRPHGKQIREAARADRRGAAPGALRRRRRAQGARHRRSCAQLAELTGIPVVTTLMARGAFPDSHRQHLGMPGMHGTVAAVTALQKADLLIALGARFDDRVTGKLDTLRARTPRSSTPTSTRPRSARTGVADVPIVGDVARGDRRARRRRCTAEYDAGRRADLTGWWRQLDQLARDLPARLRRARPTARSRRSTSSSGSGKIAGPETIFAAGVGQHQMWAAQFISYENPYTWLNSGGAGTMGYAVPAAMGAKVGRPDTLVWAIDGDGCFQMTNQELATCAIEGIPIKVAVINNGNLGMVRQWQTLFYDERYSNTELGTHARRRRGRPRIPDFVKLADALGCVGLRCETKDDVDATIEKAMAIDDQPVVVDFIVGKDAMVWPMVAAGASNDEIQAARDIRPTFEAEV